MSTLIVEVVQIDKVLPHDNADQLEIAQVKGWQCVVQKGRYKDGDKCIYVPIDSILPKELEDILFANSKVKLSGGRIKTIRLRGQVSQGLVVDIDKVGISQDTPIGTDVKDILKITKDEPDESEQFKGQIGKSRAVHFQHPNFPKYTEIENYKNFNRLFEEGEPVVVTEKLHGSNARFGWVKRVPRNFKEKILKFFGKLPKWEFMYGSHNKVLDNKDLVDAPNVWARIVNKYDLMNRIPKGHILYGEVYGAGIQKGYNYGCQDGDQRVAFFDVRNDDGYLGKGLALDFIRYVLELPTVPILYVGPFSVEVAKSFQSGPSVEYPDQKVREGIVIASQDEPRKILKLINDDYLLNKKNTNFH